MSEQLLRTRAADQVTIAYAALAECTGSSNPMQAALVVSYAVHSQSLFLGPDIACMQVSMTAHQTADQVQQKGKRITENVKHQVQLL